MNNKIKQIMDNPCEYEITKIIGDVRIGHHKYLHVLQNQYSVIENVLIPYTNGTWVSAVPYVFYEYTHGGKVYRAAVEKCHELQDAEAIQVWENGKNRMC